MVLAVIVPQSVVGFSFLHPMASSRKEVVACV